MTCLYREKQCNYYSTKTHAKGINTHSRGIMELRRLGYVGVEGERHGDGVPR